MEYTPPADPFDKSYEVSEEEFLETLSKIHEEADGRKFWLILENAHAKFRATMSTIAAGVRTIVLLPPQGSPSDLIHSGIQVSLPVEGFGRYEKRVSEGGETCLSMSYKMSREGDRSFHYARFVISTSEQFLEEFLIVEGYSTPM